MKLHFDPKQRYDCVQCGRGCKAGWDISVEPEVAASLEGHPLTLRVIQERGQAFRHDGDKIYIQNSRTCKDCGYLEPDQLCGIHKELGYAAKPATCKLFPFVVTHTPDGIYVGTTYYCSAVRQNVGRLCAEHETDLHELLCATAPTNLVANDGLVITNRYYVNWRDYREFEATLVERAQQIGYAEALSLATLAVAQRMADLPVLEEEIVALRGELPQVWSHPRLPAGPWSRQLDPIVRLEMCDYFKFHLDRNEWENFETSFCASETPFGLPPYNWRGTFAELNQRVETEVSDRFDSAIERYLEHLVYRKALIVNPTLLSSLLNLQMLKPFLKLLTALIAHRNAKPVCDQDYYDALEEVETYLVTHGRNRRVVNELAVDVLLDAIRRGRQKA